MGKKDLLYKALKEVSVVLEYTDPKLRAKVPKNFVWFMENFKDDTHEFHINLSKPLHEQNLCYESIVILSIILKSAWCDKKTLEKLQNKYKVTKNEFMLDRIKHKERIDDEIRALTIPKKDNVFRRILNGLKGLFNKNKNRLYIPE